MKPPHPSASSAFYGMRPFLAVLSLLLAMPAPAHSSNPKEGIPTVYPKKKLIAAGWDSPDPETLLAHLPEFEKTPFNGVRIEFEVRNEAGKKIGTRRTFTADPWKREWFQSEVETLRKIRSDRLTDNFLSVGPGSQIDWFDDAAWEQVVEHYRIIGWMVREGRLKGILFNAEIGISQPAFSYNRQPARTRYSFAEYAAKVRERGRAVMEALAAEAPGMTIFSMFLNGGQAYSPFHQTGGHGGRLSHFYFDGGGVKPAGPTNPSEVQEQNAPLEKIEGGSYNLLPAFLNGWLDAVPPTMTIVDGLEQTYTATDRQGFLYWANNVRNTALPLVAPENRLKYRAQVQVGFGIYLDPYVNPPGSKYHIGPDEKGSRVDRLQSAIAAAINVTDQYVWTWGEKYRWWPTKARRVDPRTWEEIAPGITDALRFGADPAAHFRQELAKAGEEFAGTDSVGGDSLLKDGDFSEASQTWSAHLEDGTTAPPDVDSAVGHRGNGSARLAGSSNVSYIQNIAIPKGKADRTGLDTHLYGIRGWARQTGKGRPEIRIRWRKGDGSYLFNQSDNIRLSPIASEKTGEWMPIRGVVAVPPGMNTLSLQLTSVGQKESGDVVWFDDIEVVRIR
ncbi:MAG TPA: hypothetical protein VNQ90_10760 [Chthoniobacteraceae bacterium]|nr:hypothetical protein [Chthoniobacteraceae bacterium]